MFKMDCVLLELLFVPVMHKQGFDNVLLVAVANWILKNYIYLSV